MYYPSMSANPILRKIGVHCKTELMESIADHRTPTASDDNPSKLLLYCVSFFRLPLNTPLILPRLKTIMPKRVGWCEGTE